MANVLDKYSGGVSSVSINDEHINRLIIVANKINGLRPALIEPHIPRKQGLRSTFAFQCLLNINVVPRLTKAGLARSFNTCRQSTCHTIDYLNELGLVYELGKPRLIIPFQRFKVDTAYNITPKGFQVIRDVLTIAGVI
jgi:hypothetical protein